MRSQSRTMFLQLRLRGHVTSAGAGNRLQPIDAGSQRLHRREAASQRLKAQLPRDFRGAAVELDGTQQLAVP